MEKENKIYEIRAYPAGRDLYDTFISNNFIAIGWPGTGDVSEMEESQLKLKLSDLYDLSGTHLSQVVSYFNKLKDMKIGDVLLIPHIDVSGKTLTIASVVKPYYYNEKYSNLDCAHQVGIKVIEIFSRDYIAGKFNGLNRSLNTQQTLTLIDKNKHAEAYKYIFNLVKSQSQKNVHSSNLSSLVNIEDDNSNLDKSIKMVVVGDDEEIQKLRSVYTKEINDSYSIINLMRDERIIKAMLFVALTARETYFRDIITMKLNKIFVNGNDTANDIMTHFIFNKLHEQSTRGFLTKRLLDTEESCTNFDSHYTDLRNALAHNMSGVVVDADSSGKTVIKYKTHPRNTSYEAPIKIEKLFTDLKKYHPKFLSEDNF